MTDFHFLHPAWLLALLPLFGLLLLRLRAGAGGDPWRGIVDPYLLRHLRPPVAHRRPVRRILLPAAGALLAVLALAGPAWERVPPPRVRTAVPPLVILLDLSRSMTATDVSPSRLAVARTLIHSLLQRLPPREVGLVVFAGGAHRVMPLTEDRRLIQSLLPRLEPGLMPVQGSNASAALRLAGRLLVQDGRHRGDLLLVTDSVDPSARARAAELAEAGIRVSVAGIGTRAGGPVPDPETGRLASAGRPVTVRLEATQLQAVARAGGGVYREGLAGLDGLLQGVERGNRGGMTGSAPETGPRVWRDRGPWLLLPLLALGLPAFRRGGALGLLLLPLLWPLLLSPPASAGGWERLWLNPGQQAERLLRRGEYRAAAERYRDPLRKGVALYLAGDYAAAAALLARSDQALAHYDRGNALLRLGRTREAIQAYQRALSLQPGYRKARDNLALARRLLAAAEGRGRSLSPPDARKRQRPPDRPGNKKRHTAADSNPPVARPPGHRPGREQRRPGPGGGNAQAPGATRPGPAQATGGRSPGDNDTGGKRNQRPARPPPPGSARPGKQTGGKPARPPSPSRPPATPRSRTNDRPPATKGGNGPEAAAAGAGRPPGVVSSRRPAPTRPAKEPVAGAPQGKPAPASPGTARERGQALEHWLDRVPDDSGDLLRELFRREHQRGRDLSRPGEPW